MSDRDARIGNTLYLMGCVFIVAWSVAGFFSRKSLGSDGYSFGPDYAVTRVREGRAGDKAGIRAGDRIVSVEGVPVEALGMQSRWNQPREGDRHRIVFERNGERVATSITYMPLIEGGEQLLVLAFMGLALMGTGFWTLVRVRTIPARQAAYAFILLSYSIALSPNLGTWEGINIHAVVAAALLAGIFLLRFFRAFPTPKRVGLGRVATAALFGAVGLFVVLSLVEVVVHPRLVRLHGTVTSILFITLLGLILISGIQSLFRSWKSLWRSGMGWVGVGVGTAILPTILLVLLGFAAPDFDFPGSQFTPVFLAFIPAGMALGIRQNARWDSSAESG